MASASYICMSSTLLCIGVVCPRLFCRNTFKFLPSLSLLRYSTALSTILYNKLAILNRYYLSVKNSYEPISTQIYFNKRNIYTVKQRYKNAIQQYVYRKLNEARNKSCGRCLTLNTSTSRSDLSPFFFVVGVSFDI